MRRRGALCRHTLLSLFVLLVTLCSRDLPASQEGVTEVVALEVVVLDDACLLEHLDLSLGVVEGQGVVSFEKDCRGLLLRRETDTGCWGLLV